VWFALKMDDLVAVTLDFKHIDVNFRAPAPADSKGNHIGFSLERGLPEALVKIEETRNPQELAPIFQTKYPISLEFY